MTLYILSFLLLRLLILPTPHNALSDRVPIRYKINQKQTECIYEKFEQEDFVTFSIFVVETLMNGKPVASLTYEGPIAANPKLRPENSNNVGSVSLGREIKTSLNQHWPKIQNADKHVEQDKQIGVFNRKLKVDWTHAGDAQEAVKKREEINKQQRENFEHYNKIQDLEARERALPVQRMTMSKVEPYEETRHVRMEGWYRMCVTSEYHPLIVEMDIRVGTVDEIDRDTGHVYTHFKMEMLDEQRLIEMGINSQGGGQLDSNTYASENEEREKEIANQVREHDLASSKKQLIELNTLTADMMQKMRDHQYRLKDHDSSAKRNYNELVWSSKIETLLFAIITGFQVYTVRKWLLSDTLLGGK